MITEKIDSVETEVESGWKEYKLGKFITVINNYAFNQLTFLIMRN